MDFPRTFMNGIEKKITYPISIRTFDACDAFLPLQICTCVRTEIRRLYRHSCLIYICMAQLSSFWTVNISKSAQSRPLFKLLSFLLVSVARNVVIGSTDEIRGYAEVEKIILPSVRSQSLSRTFLCNHICRS